MLRMKKRALLAFLASLAVVAVSAAPAGANPEPYLGTVTAGTIEITGTDFEIDLSEEPEENPCDLDWWEPEVDVDVNHKVDPVTVDVTGINFPKATFQSTVNDEWYQLDLSWPGFGSNAGDIDMTRNPNWIQDMFLIGTVYSLGGDNEGPATCEKTELACVVGVQLELEGPFNHTIPSGTLSSSDSVNGDPLQVNPVQCPDTVIEGQLDGEGVIMSGVVIEF